MADALVLRNHLIECFERADAAADETQRRGWLTVAVIGGGLVGTELVGELTAFADDVLRFYPRIHSKEVRFYLFEAGPRILPELDAKLAATAARVLQRRGVDIRVSTRVRSIDAGRVRLENETSRAAPIVLAPGIVPSAIASAIAVGTRPAWPDIGRRRDAQPQPSSGMGTRRLRRDSGAGRRPYPALAQHAIREARRLAENIKAVIDRRTPSAFVFRSLGTMASLGHTRAVARAFGVPLTGFPPGGCGGPTTSFRCRAGTGGCALSSTGQSHSSSGRTSRGSTCVWNASR
jgi:NADH dehydrogenase